MRGCENYVCVFVPVCPFLVITLNIAVGVKVYLLIFVGSSYAPVGVAHFQLLYSKGAIIIIPSLGW